MSKITASITTSLDGYITGPDDRPGRGLGEGGERLHYWVFGGPWTYEGEQRGEATGADKEFIDTSLATAGAVIAGMGTYRASDAWGGSNPFGVPLFIVTHRPQDAPPGQGFEFVSSLEEALEKAREAAGEKNVNVMGGAEVIRQALRGDYVEELTISIAPVVLGAGKRLFEGFATSLDLEPIRVLRSPLATHLTYRVLR